MYVHEAPFRGSLLRFSPCSCSAWLAQPRRVSKKHWLVAHRVAVQASPVAQKSASVSSEQDRMGFEVAHERGGYLSRAIMAVATTYAISQILVSAGAA